MWMRPIMVAVFIVCFVLTIYSTFVYADFSLFLFGLLECGVSIVVLRHLELKEKEKREDETLE